MTRTLGLFFGCALLAACGGDKGSDPTDSATTPTGCQLEILGQFPDVGANDVYYRTSVEVTFDALDGSETLTVSNAGAAVAGTTTTVDNTLVFAPDEPLMSSTTYSVELTWCGGPTTYDFTTSAVGDPVDESSLVGNTYTLDLSSGRFTQPPGVGDIIGGLLTPDTAQILIGVTAADASELSVMGALGDGAGGQDMCTESFAFPLPASFTDNETDTLNLSIEGIDLVIEDLLIGGSFSPDNSYIDGATLKGFIDVNILAELVGDDPCALLVTFGVSCEECSDGSGAHCLGVEVDSMRADMVGGLTLEERDATTIACDQTCTATPPTTVTCP